MAFPLGTDIACVSDLDFAMTTVSGKRALAQAIARRLTTQPGSLFYDLDYGYDLRQLLSLEINNPSTLVPRIESEILKDERVEDVTVTIATIGLETLTIGIVLTSEFGPFEFTVSVSEAAGVIIQ